MVTPFCPSSLSSELHCYQLSLKIDRGLRYHEHLDTLNVSATAIYDALIADAEVQPPNWDLQGRQANAWKALGKYQRESVPYYKLTCFPYRISSERCMGTIWHKHEAGFPRFGSEFALIKL